MPAGATLSVELEVVSWYDVEDVSTDKDGGVLMTKIVESAEANDYKNPKDMGTAKMHLKVTLEDGTVVKDTRADNGDEPVSHQLDETIPICPAVEMALKKMKKGGHSKLKISPKHGFGDGNAELGVPGGATVLAEIELVEFENEKDSWDLSEDEKLETADKKKQQGNQKLKAGDLARAMRRYESAKSVLASDYKMDDDQKEKAKAMKVTIFTNMAVVEAKLGNQEAVFKNCEEALKLDENCVKALFRRGSIYSKRTDFDRAQADFDKLLSVDPDNAPVKKELALLKKRVAKETAKSKKQFGGMFDKMAASDKKKQKLNPPAPEPAPSPRPPLRRRQSPSTWRKRTQARRTGRSQRWRRRWSSLTAATPCRPLGRSPASSRTTRTTARPGGCWGSATRTTTTTARPCAAWQPRWTRTRRI